MPPSVMRELQPVALFFPASIRADGYVGFVSKGLWDLWIIQAVNGKLEIPLYRDAVPCYLCAVLHKTLCLDNADNFKLVKCVSHWGLMWVTD